VSGHNIHIVTLADVTREGVLAAVAEFDRLGRDAFLRRTGFHRSREYYLQYDGRLYDSKPIVGYAHGVSTGIPLVAADFSGGDKTVAHRLEVLGFEIRDLPYADWTRDEIILACALVEANGWKQLGVSDPGVRALSELLQSPANHPLEARHPDFRNPDGVARKTQNIVTVHPAYRGAPSNGNHLDKEVLNDFLAGPVGMHAMAARIRELLERGKASGAEPVDLDMEDTPAGEGGIALRAHLRRERDPKLRRKKIADAKRRGLPIVCEVCTFDFERQYGSHGLDYIECHHRIPLHVTGETRTRLADLALLCSNCHRMIHRTKQWLTVEELKNIVAAQRNLQASRSAATLAS
jgi:5-methylcytosine-specific restriction protein A